MNINAYHPQKKLSDKKLISLKDVKSNDIYEYLYTARDFKRKRSVGEKTLCLSDKYIMLISKHSFIRSGIAFLIAVDELGGKSIRLPMSGSDIEEALKDKDVARTIKDYGVSAFVVDTAYFHDAEIIDNYVDIPIINANSISSPCQALAALLTVWEKTGKLQGLTMAFIGNTNSSEHSLIAGAAKCGININIICPREHMPDKNDIDYCRQFCNVDVYNSIEEGLRGADVVYVCENDFPDKYTLTDLNFRHARPGAVILHTVPLNRNKDISDEIADSPNSMIFEQASNLIPVLQAALMLMLK